MKKRKQRYWLVLHSRPSESVGVGEKHNRFLSATAGLAGPWGIGEGNVPELKTGYGVTMLDLKPFFGVGIHRAFLKYSYRRGPSDDGLDDDAITVTFDPAKFDTRYLISEGIPTYVRAFDAYLVEYFDDLAIDVAAEEQKGLPANPRQHIHQIGLVSFFDEELCRRAFGLTPTQVVERTRGKAERAELFHGGAYVVGASMPLPFEQAQAKCRELTTVVRGSGASSPT